jgi:hypothetical protein
MIIATAANSRYFIGLKNLVGSIHFWAPNKNILIYDLGLQKTFLEEISNWQNVTIVRNFVPQNAPKHCRIIHTYAWKPLAIYHAIQRHPSVLWIDAGSDLRAPMTPIETYLEEEGHFFVQGQDLDMTLKSHENCYQAMGTSKENFKGKQHFAGSLQGYTQKGKAYELILKPLYQYALQRNCIAPSGSNLSNHRFDQTVLSILIYQSQLPITPHTQLLSAHRYELNPNLEQASSAIIYTARCSSSEYVKQLRTCPTDDQK